METKYIALKAVYLPGRVPTGEIIANVTCDGKPLRVKTRIKPGTNETEPIHAADAGVPYFTLPRPSRHMKRLIFWERMKKFNIFRKLK
jgi:hypothetical protein